MRVSPWLSLVGGSGTLAAQPANQRLSPRLEATGRIVLAPPFGALADRLGHRRALLAGGGLALLWPAPAPAPGLLAFTVSWSVLSGSAAAVFAVSFSLLAAAAPDAVRARVIAFAYVPVTVGFAAGPALGSVLAGTNVFAVSPCAAVWTCSAWRCSRRRQGGGQALRVRREGEAVLSNRQPRVSRGAAGWTRRAKRLTASEGWPRREHHLMLRHSVLPCTS